MEGHPLHPVATAGALSPSPAVARAGSLKRTWLVVVALGAFVTLLGMFIAPERTAGGILLAAHYGLGLALGGLLFVAFGYVLRAGWLVVFRRVPEALAGSFPVGALATLTAVACVGLLYHWVHPDSGDEILAAKAWWLNVPGFVVRSLVYLAIWGFFVRAMRGNSLRQDLTRGVAETNRNVVLSALFLVVFAATFTLASVDWLMSLEPHWFSTVWAIYDFAGLFTSSLAAIILVLVVLQRAGRFPELRPDHLHDVAKLLFGFCTFWAYIWFCQQMLIWYGNIPEETAWYVHRQEGAWSVIHVLNPIVNWLIPFLLLLPRPAKRSPALLTKVCVLLLIGRWLDLYYIIGPVSMPDTPKIGPWEFAPLAVVLPLVALATFKILRRHPRVPVGDPYLGESLHHHT